MDMQVAHASGLLVKDVYEFMRGCMPCMEKRCGATFGVLGNCVFGLEIGQLCVGHMGLVPIKNVKAHT